VSRSNRTSSVRQRIHFTGEPYQLAYDETAMLPKGGALIPDALIPEQQRIEAAILHRLLHGARQGQPAGIRCRFPLFVKEANPSATGLRIVVPHGEVAAFGAALAMSGGAGAARPPSQALSIRRDKGNTLNVTAGEASEPNGLVVLQCSWDALRASVATDPHVSASLGRVLRFRCQSATELPEDGRAILSGLLRRIALFTDPAAFNWLLAWHEWLVHGRAGKGPSCPPELRLDLSDESCGLPNPLARALGVVGPAHRPTSAATLRSGNRVRPTIAHELLGRRLRSLRNSAGISPATAAERIHGSASKIARIELGRIQVKEHDLEQLLTLYRVTHGVERRSLQQLNSRLNEEEWWRPFGSVLDDASPSLLVLESIADYIWEYDVRTVPNILQTTQYAQEVLRLKGISEDRVRGLAEVHTRRQRQALERGTQRIWAILDYSAIAAGIDDPDIMREQVEFLMHASALRQVSIQVLIPRARAQATAGNSFTLLRLPGKGLPDIVHPHLLYGQLLLSHPEDTEPYRHALADISIAAEDPTHTQEILKGELRRLGAR